MIKELANFTKNLDEDFKKLAVKPREGLHLMMRIEKQGEQYVMNEVPVAYEIFSKKMQEQSEFIQRCKFLTQNAWCIDTNKCFDLPTKAIHTCSPLLVAFKREHIAGGTKYAQNASSNKKQLNDRFSNYFVKAFDLIEDEEKKQKYTLFKNFFTQRKYEVVLKNIENALAEKRITISHELEQLKQLQKDEKAKAKKEEYKDQIKLLEHELLKVKPVEESEYFMFYLDEPIEEYIRPHSKYLSDKLFNTDKYNTPSDEEGVILGTSNFMNSFNSNMPFLSHQTATFQITGRISNIEAKLLSEFLQLVGGKILPNPLPIFIFKDELQLKSIGLFKEYGSGISYKKIIESLLEDKKVDIGNYYLLNWVNSADGIIFRDLDYVSKFEYQFEVEVIDLFNINYSPRISTIFEFQNEILPVIFNNNLIVKTKDSGIIQKYFDDIDPQYCKSALNHISILKYRQAFYDFVYKSKRSAVTNEMFYDIMKVSILEDIRLDKIENSQHKDFFNIRKKLNIWFSLFDRFNLKKDNNNQTMASKLKDYQTFVDDLINDQIDFSLVGDEKFMFASGQVIDYLMSKSKSGDQSYQLLEPYTQKSNCKELQKAIANDFARYKHANYSNNFEKVASFVLTYDTDKNLKNYLPELLAGVFSKNQLFANKKETINQ